MKTRLSSVCLLCGALSACATTPQAGSSEGSAAAMTNAPATERRPVTDTFHGVEVTEDYRWLEDWSDPAVKAWSEAQNTWARRYLDGLEGIEALGARVREVLSAKTVTYWGMQVRGERLFAKKRQPPKQVPFLVVMPSAERSGEERVLVDPNVIDETGKTAIDWYVASFDGRLVAVSMSKGGTEVGDVHVFDVETGKQVHEVVPRVNSGTAGGSLAWAPDDSGFYYTRHPRGDERPAEDMSFYQQVYFHALGTPTEKDRYEIGKDFPRIAETQLDVDRRTGRVLATIQKGDGGEFSHYLRAPDGSWKQFSTYGDKTIQADFGHGDELYVLTRKDAPRGKLLRVPIAKLSPDLAAAQATTILEQGEDTIETDFWSPPTVLPTASRLYVVFQTGGPSEIRAFSPDGKALAAPKQLPVSSVYDLASIGGDDILFGARSYVKPPAYYRYDAAKDETTKTSLETVSPVDVSDIEVVREFATSKDGTKVPVNILMKKGTKLDGTNPAVVYGYGGYGVSLEPRFSLSKTVLLDQGIVYAIANLRGGGEYGEQWHRQGNLTNKQNVFDDFAAVLDHMVERGYTKPERTAILGGSNGGLLMGATMVQHHTSAKTVVSFVGIYDMLRVELSPNGEFNVTEFGTVKEPDHFEALRAYSPYHNVADGTPYPPTLFLTGANDPRVDPMQSRKMTARLQAAASAGAPILLRTSMDTGHGGKTGLEERIAQTTDAYGFIFEQLGVKFRAP